MATGTIHSDHDTRKINLTWLVARALGWTNLGSSACSFDPPTWGRWMGTPPLGREKRQERVIGAGFDLGGYVPRYADGECIDEVTAWLREKHWRVESCSTETGSPMEICEIAVNCALAHGVFK